MSNIIHPLIGNPVLKERLSNIELFRIISILFVIIVHADGWFLGMPDRHLILTYGLTFGVLSRFVIESMTVICVDSFILISGYFSIKPKFKSIVNLFTLLFFFYILSYFSDCLINDHVITLKSIIGQSLSFSRNNWFIQSYLMLMLFSPMLNIFMENTKSIESGTFIIVFLFCAFWFGCIRDVETSGFNKGYSVVNFSLIYLIGRYIKMYYMPSTKKIPKRYYLLSYFILSFVILIFAMFDIKWSFYYCSPFVIFSSITFFLFFINWEIKKNRLINYIGVSCLAAFILHTCSPVFDWFRNFDIYASQNYNYFKYVLCMGGIIILIFIISITLDKVRLFLFRPLLTRCNQVNILFLIRKFKSLIGGRI
jgi:surface polysaccharide O-acyltransferase-like enzyme